MRTYTIRFDLFRLPLIVWIASYTTYHIPHTTSMGTLGTLLIESIQKVCNLDFPWPFRLLLCKFCCCFSFVSIAFCFSLFLCATPPSLRLCPPLSWECVWERRQRKWGIYRLQANYVEELRTYWGLAWRAKVGECSINIHTWYVHHHDILKLL